METKKITVEMYNQLKKALPDKAVTKHPTKTYLSSIKAIYVTERLNDVFGCGSWQVKGEKISENEKGFIVVKTTLTIPEYGVYYESFGGNDNGGDTNKNFDLGDAYKGATTDGITKIGSYLGIGMSVFQGAGNADAAQIETEAEKENKVKLAQKFAEEKLKVFESLASHKTVEALGVAYKALPLSMQQELKEEVTTLKTKIENGTTNSK